MTTLIVIGIILLILLLLASVRVGVIFHFGDVTTLKLRIGFIRVTILPKKKKEKDTAKADAAPKKTTGEKKKNKLTPLEVYDLVTAIFSGLRAMAHRAGKRLRVDPLELSAVIGGSDPAEIAQRFGAANAALWSLMPQAEEILHIPDPTIHLDMDYNAPKTVVTGTVGLSFRVGNVIEFTVAAAIPLLRWYKTYRKAHANGQKPNEAAKQATKQTEEKLSA